MKDETTIQHDYLIHMGFKKSVKKHLIKFDGSGIELEDISYDPTNDCYLYYTAIFSFIDLLKYYGEYTDVSVESFKLYKRSKTIKKILHDNK